MLKSFVLGAVGAAMLSSIAAAQTCGSYTYTLTNGQTADANQVMQNFGDIRNCVNTKTISSTTPILSGSVTISDPSQPSLKFLASSGGADQKYWDVLGSNSLVFRAVNDAYSNATLWMVVTRGSGNTISNITFPSLPVYAANFYSTSDQRLKTNIQPVTYGLSTIMQMKPVSFDWITPPGGGAARHEIGLVAQDVQGLVPEAVSTQTDQNKTLTISYGALVPVLIKSVQELQAQNVELRSRIQAIESKTAALAPK